MARRNPADPPPPPASRHLQLSDLRGVALLATQATVGVSRITEGVHQAVWHTLGAAGGRHPAQTRGVTGLVYRGVEGLAGLLGRGAAGLLARLEILLAGGSPGDAGSPERAAVLAAVNGVLGDQLAATGNPLATRMALVLEGTEVDPRQPPAALTGGRRVVLLVHGLCMHDGQWRVDTPQGVFDHGDLLGRQLDAAVVALRYNSGRALADNGATLADLMEQWLGRPGAATPPRISVVAHSMGGLLMRSALDQARERGMVWPGQVRDIVFLGTPHHGAPLERIGNAVDALLDSTRWSRPFAALARLRSTGITDLRHGTVRASASEGEDRFARGPDRREPVALPAGIACYTVAATLAGRRSPLADRLVGDGLVPLRSALGQHDDPRRTLAFTQDARCIAWRTGHLDLLRSPLVAAQLARWLA